MIGRVTNLRCLTLQNSLSEEDTFTITTPRISHPNCVSRPQEHVLSLQIQFNKDPFHLMSTNRDARILPSIDHFIMQVHEQILSKKDAKRVSYEYMLEGLWKFLPKDSKHGKCDKKNQQMIWIQG